MTKRVLDQSNNWEVSFFHKGDSVKTEKYGNSETFESPKRQIEQIGHASLLFTRFDEKDIPNMYQEDEKVYGIDSFGNFMLANARGLALSSMFEVMVSLKTKKKMANEQMICNLWIKNQTNVFSTYMESKKGKKQSTSYIGGFTWWSSEEMNKNIKKLLLPKNMHILSNICLSVAMLPNPGERKDLDDMDETFFW